MIIENKFEIGQTVFLITDEDQKPRLVISIRVNKYDLVYELNSGTIGSFHFDFEISEEKQLQLS